MSPYATYIPLSDVVSFWPDHLFGNPDLTRVAITGYQVEQAASRATANIDLAFGGTDDLVFPIVGIDGFELFLPPAELSIEAEYAGAFELRASGFNAGLRIGTTLLVPVDGTYPNWIPHLENGEPAPLEMTLEVGQLVVDADFCPTFEITNALTLPAFMLGSSGIVIVVSGARLCLSGKEIPPPGQPEGFRGVSLDEVKVYLPPSFDLPGVTPESIAVRSLVIGHGGISGSFSAEWQTGWEGLTPVGDGAGTLLGLPFALKSAGVAITQNALTSAVFTGEIGIPFLDTVLGVAVTLDSAGALAIGLSQADDSGLITIDIKNLGTLTLSSLSFVDDEQGAGLILSGSVLPSVLSPTLQWPSIDVSGLRIGVNGDIQLPGGWLDLQTPVALDLYGFRLEISRIGFGSTDDGRRWVGFSAGVHLVDFLPTGVSVEGLRITWDPTGHVPVQVTLQGVGLELTLPGVLTLDGDVAFVNEDVERYFKGNVKLALVSLGITLDASIKVGRNLEEDYKFVYTFMDVTLPVGIPLFATGAALYGISGMYGMNVNPSATNGDWYGWYAGPPAPLNVTNADKWIGTADGKAIGAGLTIGTLFDLGRVVSVKGLFVLVLPGPVIMLHGKANFLQTPPDNDDASSEGVLNALAVLDGRAGTLQLNVDAAWSLSQAIDIAASAEAFFDFSNPRNWHFYLGQNTPEDRRIRASLLSLLHGDAYLMIDRDGIATGGGISWGDDWRFGPVTVVLRAWISADAAITWVPPQLEGSLNLGGEFEIAVAGFGAGLSAEATLSGKTPTLYWVRGELTVQVKLPWPLKDFEEEIVLEWRQELAPPIEPAQATISVEHLKVDETWTGLPALGSTETPVAVDYAPGPIIPLDARPSISFDRGMKDITGRNTFTSVDAYGGGVKIGDYTFDYELLEVALHKWPKAGGTAWTPVEDVYGTWMAVEDGNGEPAFTRLQLWSKSPFAFTRQTSRTYRDAFLANHTPWPCVTQPEVVTHCVDWDEVKIGKQFGSVFQHQGLWFALLLSDAAEVVAADEDAESETTHALRIEDGNLISLWIVFPEPVHTVELHIAGHYLVARAFANGALVSEVPNPEAGSLGFQGTGIDCIVLFTSDNCQVAKICYQTEAMVTDYTNTFEHNLSVYDGLKRWDSKDEILEPETFYRLTLRHQTVRTHNGSRDTTEYTRYTSFHTAGAPGLSPVWAVGPAPASNGETSVPFPHGGRLTGLAPYIAWTIPSDGATPVYGSYDLGAEFNENYVEQMLGADMAIRLTDANAKPVLDASGQEIVFPNQWAEQPVAELSETEYTYTTRVEGCTTIPVGVAADQKIAFATNVLFEEDFSGTLEQWTDAHPSSGGKWSIQEGRLLYSNTARVPLGALLVAGEVEWTDYAIEITLSGEGSDVGLAWRYTNLDRESYYRLRLNASGRFLERVAGGVEVLWQDAVAYAATTGVILAVQCEAGRLRAQLDDELLFDVRDAAPLLTGQVGIFANMTAAFEQYLVRTWPGSVLAPQTQYRAELQASFPVLAGGLSTAGWIDTAYDWLSLTRDNARIAALGRDVWTDTRVEVNAQALGRQIGLIARFTNGADTFTCYRLVVNLHLESVQLARISGTISGSTYQMANTVEIFSCSGPACAVDFALSTHDLALTCAGDVLIVEIDGTEMCRRSDSGGLTVGKAGLFYLGDDEPVFSDLVVRTAPRGTVHDWSFTTSRYASFVEHLDTFTGQVHPASAGGANVAALTGAVTTARSEIASATSALANARTLLASAGAADVTIRREAALAAGLALRTAMSVNFDVLYPLLLGGTYRPLPPVVEVSELMRSGRRLALLVESPEPIDWHRVSWQLRKEGTTPGVYQPVANTVLVASDDGARALITNTVVRVVAGNYELGLTYSLDIGLEAPALRRGGSTVAEVARMRFNLA